MRGIPLIALVASLVGIAAHGQAPRGTPAPQTMSSTPAAVRPGATTEVTFSNALTGEPTGLWTSFPADVAAVSSGGKGSPAARFRLTVPPDAPVGIGAVRVATTGGVSGLQFFMVDDLPTLAAGPAGRTSADARPVNNLCA